MFKEFLSNSKKILSDQSGMQVLEAVGLAVIGLIFVALIFNSTKSGLDETAGKVGNTLDAIGGARRAPRTNQPVRRCEYGHEKN
jgi:hypothetical protein